METKAILKNVDPNVTIPSVNVDEINKLVRSKEIVSIDPRIIYPKDGFNSRTDFDLSDIKPVIKANYENCQPLLNQPISVIPIKVDGIDIYQLVDGERRWRSIMELIADGLPIARIDCKLLPRNMSEVDKLAYQINSNTSKRFTEYEMATAFKKFTILGLTNADIAKKTGRPVSYVIEMLKLLDTDQSVQDKIANGEISSVAVREIIHATNDNDEVTEFVNKTVEAAQEEAKKKGKDKIKATAKHIIDDVYKLKDKKSNDTKMARRVLGLMCDIMDELEIQCKEKEAIRNIWFSLNDGKTLKEAIIDELG